MKTYLSDKPAPDRGKKLMPWRYWTAPNKPGQELWRTHGEQGVNWVEYRLSNGSWVQSEYIDIYDLFEDRPYLRETDESVSHIYDG